VLSICVLARPTPIGWDGEALSLAEATSIAPGTAALAYYVIPRRRLELEVSIDIGCRGV